jgi:hypothetical protein
MENRNVFHKGNSHRREGFIPHSIFSDNVLKWGSYCPFMRNKEEMKFRDVEAERMEISLLWIGAGLAAFGYFIGDGLKNFKNPKSGYRPYPVLIKEKDLPYYLGLKQEEIEDLIRKCPDVPKIELKGTTYYPYKQLLEWAASDNGFREGNLK